jgi:hypothetical protein
VGLAGLDVLVKPLLIVAGVLLAIAVILAASCAEPRSSWSSTTAPRAGTCAPGPA